MDQTPIESDTLETFLLEAVPSFREECDAARAVWGDDSNTYSLLSRFEKHLERLQSENRELGAYMVALAALDALLTRGSSSVKDAAVIQVVDLLIRNEKLREPAKRSGLKELTKAIATQTKAWEEYRRH